MATACRSNLDIDDTNCATSVQNCSKVEVLQGQRESQRHVTKYAVKQSTAVLQHTR